MVQVFGEIGKMGQEVSWLPRRMQMLAMELKQVHSLFVFVGQASSLAYTWGTCDSKLLKH